MYQLKKSNSSRYTNVSVNTTDKSIIRLIDYGSKPCSCRPKPAVYEELEKKYQDTVVFEYIDVFTAAKNGIKVMPTQVIYNANYNVIARHEGTPTKEDIIKLLEQAGVK